MTLTAAHKGKYELMIIAHDGKVAVTASFTLRVNTAPVYTAFTITQPRKTIAWSYKLPDGTFTDAEDTLTYTCQVKTTSGGTYVNIAGGDWIAFDVNT